MAEKKLYEKPVLEYCGKMTEHTKFNGGCEGSCQQATFV
jgi:hypothetical protein